jgi:hypothetical protein
LPDFVGLNIDLRFGLAKTSQSSIRHFSIRRFQRIAKQLAVDADMGKIDADAVDLNGPVATR